MEISQAAAVSESKRRMNQLGGRYTSGRPLSRDTRMRIIDLSRQGFRQCDISRYTRVTHGCISKLLAKYQQTGMVESAQNVGRPRVITEAIERKIREFWASDPGIFCWEIRERLLREEVCQPSDLPSLSSISRVLKENMVKSANMVQKKRPLAEERSQEASYTRFTIANILELEGHADETSNAEEKSTESKGTLFQTSQRRERTKFTPMQIYELEREFQRNPYPATQRRKDISKKLHIEVSKIQVWFANRRARGKKNLADLMRQPPGSSAHSPFVFRQTFTPITMPHCSIPYRHFLPITHQRMYNSE